MGRVDPAVERPELRTFDFRPRDEVLRNRAQLVCDALTVLRAHLVAGQPRRDGVVDLGSYEGWCRLVRDPLVWLGEADPVASLDEVREEDPKREVLDAMMQGWERLGTAGVGRISASGLIELAKASPEFQRPLFEIARRRDDICALRLGRWINTVKGRFVNGRRINAAGKTNGVSMYQLEVQPPVKGSSGS